VQNLVQFFAEILTESPSFQNRAKQRKSTTHVGSSNASAVYAARRSIQLWEQLAHCEPLKHQ